MGVWVQLLGPIRVWRDQREIRLGPPGQRAVFALLALDAGRRVSRDDLVNTLWQDRPPAQAVNVLQTYVKNLRQALEPDRPPHSHSSLLPLVSGGYVLEIDFKSVDALRFHWLVQQVRAERASSDPARVAATAREALGLWHGRVVEDVPSLAHHPWATTLEDERWAAISALAESALTLGTGSDVAVLVQHAAAARPFDEAAQALLIRVYQAVGRRSEALATYERVRRRLSEELGVDPGPELRNLYEALLREDSTSSRPSPTPARRVVPAQLPLDVQGFVGRTAELAALDAALASLGEHSTAVGVVATWGTAGVGKTALTVQWAHRVARQFPDGQLYVNMRGFDSSGSLMTPEEAVRGFLDAFEVPAQRIPFGLPAQTALYRSLLDGKRVLVVVDNVRDVDQVRPLLPGAPGCLALVTSRNQLTGLVAAENAHPLPLDLLTPDDAKQLLVRRIGVDRVADEPDAVDQLVALCAGLPLALAIAAARAASQPRTALAALVEDIRTAYSCSYKTIGEEAARLFRLLGLHPGPDVSTRAAASLAELPADQARALLTELVRAQLITEPTAGRYSFHDLLRAYAAELVQLHDSEIERRTAIQRVLDHYMRTAHAAALLIDPHRTPTDLPSPVSGVTHEPLEDEQHAMTWFADERPVLLAVVRGAAEAGYDREIGLLAWALLDYLDRRGHWVDQVAVQRLALDSAVARRSA
jgi:DNA-binding SARP family transcriptional activator